MKNYICVMSYFMASIAKCMFQINTSYNILIKYFFKVQFVGKIEWNV